MTQDEGEFMLGLWADGAVSDDAVVSWAVGVIGEWDSAAPVPLWLVDLSVYGPRVAGKREGALPVGMLAFEVLFAWHVVRLDLGAGEEVERFVRWVSGAAMGEDVDVEAVSHPAFDAVLVIGFQR